MCTRSWPEASERGEAIKGAVAAPPLGGALIPYSQYIYTEVFHSATQHARYSDSRLVTSAGALTYTTVHVPLPSRPVL